MTLFFARVTIFRGLKLTSSPELCGVVGIIVTKRPNATIVTKDLLIFGSYCGHQGLKRKKYPFF